MHIPYKGDAPALNDVVAGHVPMVFITITTALPFVKSGKLKGLATTGDKPSDLAPDVPTMTQAGVAGFETKAWYMIFAPRKTPTDILEKMNKAVNAAMADASVQRLSAQGVAFTGGTMAQAETFLASEIDRWGTLIKAANIKAE